MSKNNSTQIVKGLSDSSNSQLWIPYFLIGFGCVVFLAIHFWCYHKRNRERYLRKREEIRVKCGLLERRRITSLLMARNRSEQQIENGTKKGEEDALLANPFYSLDEEGFHTQPEEGGCYYETLLNVNRKPGNDRAPGRLTSSVSMPGGMKTPSISVRRSQTFFNQLDYDFIHSHKCDQCLPSRENIIENPVHKQHSRHHPYHRLDGNDVFLHCSDATEGCACVSLSDSSHEALSSTQTYHRASSAPEVTKSTQNRPSTNLPRASTCDKGQLCRNDIMLNGSNCNNCPDQGKVACFANSYSTNAKESNFSVAKSKLLKKYFEFNNARSSILTSGEIADKQTTKDYQIKDDKSLHRNIESKPVLNNDDKSLSHGNVSGINLKMNKTPTETTCAISNVNTNDDRSHASKECSKDLHTDSMVPPISSVAVKSNQSSLQTPALRSLNPRIVFENLHYNAK